MAYALTKEGYALSNSSFDMPRSLMIALMVQHLRSRPRQFGMAVLEWVDAFSDDTDTRW